MHDQTERTRTWYTFDARADRCARGPLPQHERREAYLRDEKSLVNPQSGSALFCYQASPIPPALCGVGCIARTYIQTILFGLEGTKLSVMGPVAQALACAYTSAPSCSTTELGFDQCGSGGSVVGWKATEIGLRRRAGNSRKTRGLSSWPMTSPPERVATDFNRERLALW